MAWMNRLQYLQQNENHPLPPPSYIASTQNSSSSSDSNDQNKRHETVMSRMTNLNGNDNNSDQQNSAFIRPWLGLHSRLFLSIFTPALASLLFVGVGVLSSTSDANQNVLHVKNEIYQACLVTQKSANTLANSPMYFTKMVNQRTSNAINDTVHGLARVLLLALTAIEHILVFIVDTYRSLMLCFIELLVRGSLALLIAAVDALSGALNDAAKAISTSIEGSVNAINASLRSSLGVINDIAKLFHKSITIPQIPLPDLKALQNVHLPTEIDGGLRKLNETLPTLDELKQKMDQLIETPFEEMKKEINNTITNYQFDHSILPTPSQTNLTFCQNQMDLTPIDKLANHLRKAAYIGIGILILLAILVILFYATLQWYEYQGLKKHVDRSINAFRSAHGGDGQGSPDSGLSRNMIASNEEETRFRLMSFLQLSQHAFLASIFLPKAHKVGVRSSNSISRLRWWLAWISHPVPLAIFAMGIVGLIGVLIQIVAINIAEKQVKGQTIAMIDDNTAKLQDAINEHLLEISQDFVNKSNIVILNAQNDLNNGLFKWVNTTTTTMNNTLNEFMDGITTAINVTFSKTPLYTPVQSFIGCILGSKVVKIEEALTWIHDNAHVTFPTVDQNLFLLDNSTIQKAIQPTQNDLIGGGEGGGGDNPHSGLLHSIANSYLNHLRKQRTMFLILIAIYLALVCLGTILALLHGRTVNSTSTSTSNYWNLTTMFNKRNGNEEKSPVSWENGEARDHEVLHFDQPSSNLGHGNNPAPHFEGVNRGHQSISRPLLPDVVSLHSQRELARERQQFDEFIRSHAKASNITTSSSINSVPSYPIEVLTGSDHNTMQSSRITCTDQVLSPIQEDENKRRGYNSVTPGVGYRGIPRVLNEDEKKQQDDDGFIQTEILPLPTYTITQTKTKTSSGKISPTTSGRTYIDSVRSQGKGAVVFDVDQEYQNRTRTKFGIHDDSPVHDINLIHQSNVIHSNSGMAF